MRGDGATGGEAGAGGGGGHDERAITYPSIVLARGRGAKKGVDETGWL